MNSIGVCAYRHMFCHEQAGIEADCMTTAKGQRWRIPTSSLVVKQGHYDAPIPGGLAGTYGGSLSVCAGAGLALFDVIEEGENL